MSIPVMMVPLLKGNCIWLTKNTSILPNKARVEGSNNLNMKSRIATETMLARTKFLKVTFDVVLKK